MSLRIVLLAEGTMEAGIVSSPAPGTTLAPSWLGAGHILVRRCLVEGDLLPEGAVHYVQPLRTPTGRVARGSDLLDSSTLRKLLTWPPTPHRPDLAVVLVDADGAVGRGRDLSAWTAGVGLPRVIVVAVQEFEAWLIADASAVATALGVEFQTTPDPESMTPREAKTLLSQAIGQSGKTAHDARKSIANLISLEVVAKRCPAFMRTRSALVAAAPI